MFTAQWASAFSRLGASLRMLAARSVLQARVVPHLTGGTWGGWSRGHPPFQSVGSDYRWLILAVLWVETILLLPADGKPEGMDLVGKESLK